MIKLISGQFNVSKEGVFSVIETLMQDSSNARVIFSLDIEGKNTKHTFQKVKRIFEEHFFQEDTELLLRFEECMKKVNSLLKDEYEDFNGIIAAQDHSELHVSQTGQGEAYLIRRGKLNVIIENIQGTTEEDTDSEKDTFTSIASGELLIDDKIILSSVRLLRYATASQIIAVLSEGVSEGIDSLKELLELEAEQGSVICLHARGESVFKQNDTAELKVPRYIRGSFFSNLANFFEKTANVIAEKTHKPVDVVQNTIFASLGILFSLLLIWTVSSASIDNAEKEKYESYKTEMLKIEKELQTAETRALMSDLSSSNAILNSIETKVSSMLEEGVFVDEGLAILERVQKQRDDANKVSRIKNIDQYTLTDISTASEEKIQGFTSFNDKLYTYTNTSLFSSVLDHIDPKIVITESDTIIRAEEMSDKDSIIFTLASGAILQFSGNEVHTATTTDTEGFKPGVAEASYNRFLYLLSPQENQIWKYELKREGFTAASAWLSESYDLSQAIDLAIDGSIYVLKKEGGVSLFHKGEEIALTIKGSPEDVLSGASRIFVKPDMNNVYFLNPERNSVVIFEIANKGLNYKREYIFETLTNITDFYIDQNEQRLIVSDEEKLYEITL